MMSPAAALLPILALLPPASSGAGPSLSLAWDAPARALAIVDGEAGRVLEAIRVSLPPAAGAPDGGRGLRTDDPAAAVELRGTEGPSAPARSASFRWPGSPAPDLVLELEPGAGSEARLVARWSGGGARADLTASLALGPEPLACRLIDERAGDGHVLATCLGPAVFPSARSFFDAGRDLAVTFAPGSALPRPSAGSAAPVLASSARAGEALLDLRVLRHYYRDVLGVSRYAPLDRRSFWRTAPSGALGRSGNGGEPGRPAQRKEWLIPQVDWVARNLLPWAGEMVFEIGDGYPADDDGAMRELSRIIRSRGLIPGLRIAPLTAALEGWLLPRWRKAAGDWGFDSFELAGQAEALETYRMARGEAGLESCRRALGAAREAVGPDRFIEIAGGTALDLLGAGNGFRTGGGDDEVRSLGAIVRWGFLNGIACWCGPDPARDLDRAPLARARLEAVARALSGQQVLAEDVWTLVEPETAWTWQRCLPAVRARPVNLYPIAEEDAAAYDVIDLRVTRPWGSWDAVGLLNPGPEPRTARLDLARLDLPPGSYHVLDVLDDAYLGVHERGESIPIPLSGRDAKLFSIRAASGGPAFLATTRHLSLGGLDLLALEERRDGESFIIEGMSGRLVAGDPCTIVLAAPDGLAVAGTTCDNGFAESRIGGGAARITLTPRRNGVARWGVVLAPPARPVLDVDRTLLDLGEGPGSPGGTGRASRLGGKLVVRNLGPGLLSWSARCDDARVTVAPARGSLERGREAEVMVSLDPGALPPGGTTSAELELLGSGESDRAVVRLVARRPPPADLAREARLSASSERGPGFEARRAADGSPATRWIPARDEARGAWIEIRWAAPVSFDRVVIEERVESGTRVRAWSLETGGPGGWARVARGEGLGARRAVDIPAVTADRLRLVLEDAVEAPEISTIEVQRLKPRP